MKLSFEQIHGLTLGAVRIAQEIDGVRFYRFTEEQLALYRERSEESFRRTFAASGVRLRFRTDSQSLGLKVCVSRISGRSFYSFDLFVNGERLDTLDNFTGVELPEKYVETELPLGKAEKIFSLGAGEKEICIYFPWSVSVALQELSLDDGAYILPVKPEKKLLCFGDSITQGFDALHPSCKYASRLADYLDMEEYNKGIGGEMFFPALAATKEPFVPDVITVAYGTNDWGKECARQEIEENCRGFLKNLRRNYPQTPIYAISPLWRRIWQKEKPAGPFCVVEEILCAVAAETDNVTVIPGFDLIPHELTVFGDLSVHPSDEGFACYFESLRKYF